MLERDESDLTGYLRGRPGQAVFVLRGDFAAEGTAGPARNPGDEAAAMAALRKAADAVRQIPHPVEPGEPLPNRVEALPGDAGPTLHLDMQDRGEQAPRVIAAILEALDRSGVAGRFQPVRPPGPPFDYDAGADIVTGASFLAELDGRGLPPAFPAGFPVPAGGVLVIAQRARHDTWEHAGWRRGRPFDEYPEELRRFGCALEPVAGGDRLMHATGMTRHLLRHPAGTGSVSTYHEYEPRSAPRRWYVSVVWRPA